MTLKKFIFAILVVIIGAGLFWLNFSNDKTDTSTTTVSTSNVVSTTDTTKGNHRSLIVFFSRTKGVYGVGELPIGHTIELPITFKALPGPICMKLYR